MNKQQRSEAIREARLDKAVAYFDAIHARYFRTAMEESRGQTLEQMEKQCEDTRRELVRAMLSM